MRTLLGSAEARNSALHQKERTIMNKALHNLKAIPYQDITDLQDLLDHLHSWQ